MALPPGSRPLHSTRAPPLVPTSEHSSLGTVCCGSCWAHPATVPQVASCSGHLGRPLWVDQTRLLPGRHLGPPGLLTGYAAEPSRDQGPSRKTGFKCKKRSETQARGFLMGTHESSGGCPALRTVSPGHAQHRQPPTFIPWVLLGWCRLVVLFTWLWSVSHRDNCVPGPHVRSTWFHIRTSRCSVKPVGPPGWFQNCRFWGSGGLIRAAVSPVW